MPRIRTYPTRFFAPISVFAVCLAALTMLPAAYAQYRASLRGVVSDPQGAVVPGANVTLTNTETNEKQISNSDASGIYNFNALPPGHFLLTVERDGFQKQVISDVQIIPEQPNALNIKLQLGAATQTVTVNGSDTAALDTETASLSGTITTNEIQHLPSFNRDVFQLAQLAPGVFGDGSQAGGGGSNTAGKPGPRGIEWRECRCLQHREWRTNSKRRRSV